MLITREVDYALRILRALYVEGRMTTSALCEKEKIPKAFAYKIIRKLTAAGYLTTDRGADGGVQMRTDLAGESLYDLMCEVDSRELVNNCLNPDYVCENRENRDCCTIHEQLREVQESVDDERKKRDLRSLISGKDT